MEQEKQVGIVYEYLTKKEKLKFMKSIHNKLKNHINLDVHEINFVMSAVDCHIFSPQSVGGYLYHNRNVEFTTLLEKSSFYEFFYPMIFRILYTDSSEWETITKVVNKYVSIEELSNVKYNLIHHDGSGCYFTSIHMPDEIWSIILYKTNKIYERGTKKFRDEVKKDVSNLKMNTNIKESSNNEDENDSDLVM